MAVLHANSRPHGPGLPSPILPTELPDAFYETDRVKQVVSFHMPTYDELSSIDLYREQVISYVDGVLSPLSFANTEAWLTASMVNNYTKLGLIPSPVRKAYGKDHLARLLAVCVFKQILPIASIKALLDVQEASYETSVAYDYFAVEFEHALHAVFSDSEPFDDTATKVTRESMLVRCATSAVASKIFLQGYLGYISQ